MTEGNIEKQVSEEGRRLTVLIIELLDRENADPEDALMALMCCTASIVGGKDNNNDSHTIKMLMGNLENLTRSYRSFSERMMMQ